MNCPSCAAPMRLVEGKESLVCDYCGANYLPDRKPDGVRVLGETSALPCPVCAVLLVHAALGGNRIFYCEKCRGVLVRMESFEAVIDSLRSEREGAPVVPHPADDAELRRQIHCPQCGVLMDTHRYGGPGNIVIDNCVRCQWNWLDAGEIQQVVRAPDARPYL